MRCLPRAQVSKSPCVHVMPKEAKLSQPYRFEEDPLNFASIQDFFVELSLDPVDSLHNSEAPYFESFDFVSKISVDGQKFGLVFPKNIINRCILKTSRKLRYTLKKAPRCQSEGEFGILLPRV